MFHSAHGRIGVILKDLQIPLPASQLLNKLLSLGFVQHQVQISALARQSIGTSVYQRGARTHDAPHIMDCSSFVKWVFGELGIWIPRRSIQQYYAGTPVPLDHLREGDLVFRPGVTNWYHTHRNEQIGHVGIYTNDHLIIHAANRSQGVTTSSVEDYIANGFSGCVRYIEHLTDLVVLSAPDHLDVETSDDLRWILLSRLTSP